MLTIPAEEAKSHLLELLYRSNKGESFLLVDHGKPLACLGPLPKQIRRQTAARIGERARALRHRIKPDLTPVADDIANGRL